MKTTAIIMVLGPLAAGIGWGIWWPAGVLLLIGVIVFCGLAIADGALKAGLKPWRGQ